MIGGWPLKLYHFLFIRSFDCNGVYLSDLNGGYFAINGRPEEGVSFRRKLALYFLVH